MMDVVFLGTGTSYGIPVPGCGCERCISDDPRDRRSRASILLQTPEGNILIDTATEFRLQTIANRVDRIDAVLITHDHADHLHGIDDLRVFCKSRIPLYAKKEVLEQIKTRFDYIFREHFEGGGVPLLELVPIHDRPFNVLGLPIVPVPLFHGSKEILGFRIGPFAYCTDCSGIPESSRNLLKDLDILVLDGLHYKKHSTHFTIPEALEEIERLKPRQAYLTHLSHNVGHRMLEKALPDNVEPAFDGLKISVG